MEETVAPEQTPDASADVAQLSAVAAPVDLEDLGGRQLVVFNRAKGSPSGFVVSVEDLGGTVDALYEEVGAAIVSGLDAKGAKALAKVKGVQYADFEPVLEMRLPEISADRLSSEATPASPSDPTGAFFYPDQWNMRAIDAPGAWTAGRLGSPDVTIAILDTGIDYLHNDLIGHVDLSRSISFLPEDDALVDAVFPGRNYITDLVWHGTHVSSNAVSSGWGMAGVTSQVTLMGVKVCSVFGGCPGGAIFGGIMYAIDNGADVINMSLGGWFLKKDNPGFVSIINRLINYANQNGVTIVVSAGNEAWDQDHNGNWYKTYCDAPHVICVSATGPTDWDGGFVWEDVDAPADYTNYGRSAISVAAPGGNSGDFVVGACSTTSLIITGCQASPFFYVWAAGTSMSAPHVTGLAALMVEDFGRKPGRIKNKIQQSADDLGQPGTDPWYGKGRINVGSAVGAN
jgi:subtilisin family serine protease